MSALYVLESPGVYVRVLDHFIVSTEGCMSFAETGLI